MGALALLLLLPAVGRAEESNPNNLNCIGSIKAGTPEEGSEEQQVRYSFYCDGPITGYQLQSQIPVTGIQSPPEVTSNATKARAVRTTSPAAGKCPASRSTAWARAKAGYETITGQFAIEHKICAEPREDPLLTVVSATIEKGAVVQAISGPFDLGRPLGCKADAYSGGTRLNPKAPVKKKSKKHSKHKHSSKKGKKAAHKR